MAGALVKIGEYTVSNGDGTAKITGINTDYNVYILYVKGLTPSSDDDICWRITKGGTIQTDSNYDNARHEMPTNSGSTFQDNEGDGIDRVQSANVESTGDGFFAKFHLFNFATTDSWTYGTFEHVVKVSTPQLFGGSGGFIHTVASASDGISFHFNGGATFTSGELHLYALNK